MWLLLLLELLGREGEVRECDDVGLGYPRFQGGGDVTSGDERMDG